MRRERRYMILSENQGVLCSHKYAIRFSWDFPDDPGAETFASEEAWMEVWNTWGLEQKCDAGRCTLIPVEPPALLGEFVPATTIRACGPKENVIWDRFKKRTIAPFGMSQWGPSGVGNETLG